MAMAGEAGEVGWVAEGEAVGGLRREDREAARVVVARKEAAKAAAAEAATAEAAGMVVDTRVVPRVRAEDWAVVARVAATTQRKNHHRRLRPNRS